MTILMLLFIIYALTLPNGVQAFFNPTQTTMNRAYVAANFLIALVATILYIFRFGGTIAP